MSGPRDNGFDGSDATPDAIAAQLRRITAHPSFEQAPLLSRLLQHLLDRTLAGELRELQEYALGVTIFNRGGSFDPRADNIVRANVRRLRQRLDAYYQGDGRHDPIVIDLPKGHYVVRISENRPQPPEATHGPSRAASMRRPPIRTTARSRLLAVGLIGAAVSLGFVAGWLDSERFTTADTRVLQVAEFTAHGDERVYRDVASGLRDELVRILSTIATLAVTRDPNTQSYVLSGALQPLADDRIRVTATLVDAAGRTIWSKNFDASRSDPVAFDTEVATRIANLLFVLLRDVRLESNDQNARLAFLRGTAALMSFRMEDAREALTYLNHALSIDPAFAHAWVVKANAYLMLGNYGGMDMRDAAAQMRSARDAVLKLDPHRADALLLDAQLKLYDANFTAAEESVRLARALDRGSMTVAMGRGYYFLNCGRFDEALASVQPVLDATSLWEQPKYLRIQALMYEGRVAEALAMADEILAVTPADRRARDLRAMTLWSQGRLDDALADFPLLAPTDELRAAVHRDGPPALARFLFQRARAIEDGRSTRPQNYIWRSYFTGHVLQGNVEQAIRWLREGWVRGDRWEVLALRQYPIPGFAAFWNEPAAKATLEALIGNPPTCPAPVRRQQG